MCSSISRFGVLTTRRFFFSSWCLYILLFFFSSHCLYIFLFYEFSMTWNLRSSKSFNSLHTPCGSMLQMNMEMQMWREMKRKTLRLSQMRPICVVLNICYKFFSYFFCCLELFFCQDAKIHQKKNQSLVIDMCENHDPKM